MGLQEKLGRILKLQFVVHSVENIRRNESLLHKVREPSDDIDRAFIHYKFLKLNYPKVQWYLSGLYSLVRILPSLYSYTRNAKNVESASERGGLIVVADDVPDYSDLLPSELESEYGGVRAKCDYSSSGDLKMLRGYELKIVKECFLRHPVSFKYIMHIIDGLALYAGIVKKYSPAAVATFASEDSCRVSILTRYCDEKKISHVDFMHGERFYGYTQAYTRFSDIYVWNNIYQEVFERAGIKADRWHVYVPGKYNPVVRDKDIIESKIVKCYLSGEGHEVLLRMRGAFDQLQEQGYHCVIRWHPRFSNVTETKDIFEGYEFEDPLQTSIEDSLRGAGYVLSAYSTVLLQAFYSGIPIIIDDYSDIKLVELLEYIQYWGFNECYARLTSLMVKEYT